MNFLIYVCLISLGSAIVQGIEEEPCTKDNMAVMEVLCHWKAAMACKNSTGLSDAMLNEPQQCDFTQEEDKIKEFQYCYLQYFLKEGPMCFDVGKIVGMASLPEMVTVAQCVGKHGMQCCMASDDERKTKCQPFVDCYMYSLLLCGDPSDSQ